MLYDVTKTEFHDRNKRKEALDALADQLGGVSGKSFLDFCKRTSYGQSLYETHTQ